MLKKTLVRRDDHGDLPSSGLNFIFHSYKILEQCVEILTQLDDKKVLIDFKKMHIQNLQHVKDQNLKIKKLFHIDLKQNHIYWQVLKKSKRVILKQSLQSRQKLHEWQFDKKRIGIIFPFILGSDQIIQVLGKWKYLQLKNASSKNQNPFETIHFNVLNNTFVNFQEFYHDIVSLINEKLIYVYDGRVLKYFVSSFQKDQLHQKLWEYVSIQITRIWKKFQNEIETKKIRFKYEQAQFKDITRLFNTNSDLKIEEGNTSIPKIQSVDKQISFIENAYESNNEKTFKNKNNDFGFYPLEINLHFEPRDLNTTTTFFDQSFYKYPHSENYPLAENYVAQNKENQKIESLCRKSLKRPSNKCHQNCACLKFEGQKCPNLERKIQCQHHNCNNSKIRRKKGIYCWYLDEEKNFHQLQSLRQKLTSGLQISEYHSFGLDFHTVTLLFYLLPFSRILDGQSFDNQKEKKMIIQVLIPYEVSKTQNLFLAVKKLASQRQYQKYFYETKILLKKLTWIKQIELSNVINKFESKPFTYPKVQLPKCYYKGLGVINSGLKLPKNTLIGQFIGQTMPRYRIQQKQELCAKLIKMKDSIKFYCIDVFTHLDQKSEPRFFAVDPQNKGNFCRNLNHSCNPNCKVDVIVSEGKYVLGVYTTKQIQENEQLTFDYMSVTDDYEEYKKSVCLCSSLACRGRYFRFQDYLYSDLNEKFLQKQEPIRKRIKKLMHCSQNLQRKSTAFDTRVNILKNKQINASLIPLESKLWFLHWIEINVKLIQNQLLYLYQKNINESASKLDYQICQKPKGFDPKLGEKQKIANLNAKIEKISHYLNKIQDFSPPFSSKPHEEIIKKLQQVLDKAKICKKNYCKSPITQNFNSFQRTIWNLRWNLFQVASFELTAKKNIQKSLYYFQHAFTFICYQIHKYPNYKSQPIKIWRQNNSKYKDTVQYKGKDLFILQNLVLWSGELKKIQRQGKNKIKKNKKSQNIFNDFYLLESDTDFKRQFLKNQVQLANFQIQESRFNLSLPQEIKRKSMLTVETDLKKLRKSLEKWIQRQFLYLNNSQQNFKGAYKAKKETKIEYDVKIEHIDSSSSNSKEKASSKRGRPKSQNSKSKKQTKIVKIEA